MNKTILKKAIKEFKKLKTQYTGFINVGVDNWRGYRFIFDVEPCKRCKNGCLKCPIYLLLKDKKEGLFSAGLYLANKEDKQFFGPQRYLNCKSLQQYQQCYTNYLVKETNTEKEIVDELKLIRDFKIIFSRQAKDLQGFEDKFKRAVIDDTLAQVDAGKKQIIIKLAKRLLGLYNESMIKAQTSKGSKVAVFIDAANFEISLKLSGLSSNYRELLAWIGKSGKIVTLRYYSPTFGTKGQNRFFSFIKNLGFKIITKNIKIIKQQGKKSQNKANFDVEITFDTAIRIGQFDKLILFSGDSDFVYLVSQLQKRGVSATVISPQWRTAKELRKQANEFIDLRNCEFVMKKPPFGGAHNNLSTAKRNILRKRRKVK